MSIVPINLRFEAVAHYQVKSHDDEMVVDVMATNDPTVVDQWIAHVEEDVKRLNGKGVVGFDVGWRPCSRNDLGHMVYTIHLCYKKSCLIFEIYHAPIMPQRLPFFLQNDRYMFVGVGIYKDVRKIFDCFNMPVSGATELVDLAANVLNRPELNEEGVGLGQLATKVLGKRRMRKPWDLNFSRWDNLRLSEDQVLYATMDVYLASEIGRRLTGYAFF